MDANYAGQLLLSISIFAPGLILLALVAFAAATAGLERVGIFGAERKALVIAGSNPDPADVVTNLKAAVRAKEALKKTGTK